MTLIRKVNADWFEARHDDGRVGYCPANYIEVFDEKSLMSFSLPDVDTASNYDDAIEKSSITKNADNNIDGDVMKTTNVISNETKTTKTAATTTTTGNKIFQATPTNHSSSLPHQVVTPPSHTTLPITQAPNSSDTPDLTTPTLNPSLTPSPQPTSPMVSSVQALISKTSSTQASTTTNDTQPTFGGDSDVLRTQTREGAKQKGFSTSEQHYFISQLDVVFPTTKHQPHNQQPQPQLQQQNIDGLYSKPNKTPTSHTNHKEGQQLQQATNDNATSTTTKTSTTNTTTTTTLKQQLNVKLQNLNKAPQLPPQSYRPVPSRAAPPRPKILNAGSFFYNFFPFFYTL